MKQAFIYSIKVWLTIVVGASMLSNVYNYLDPRSSILISVCDFLVLTCEEILIGVVVSILGPLLFFVFVLFLTKQDLVNRNVKLALSSINIGLVLATLLWLREGKVNIYRVGDLRLIIYPVVGLTSVWLYKLKLSNVNL